MNQNLKDKIHFQIERISLFLLLATSFLVKKHEIKNQ
jgi:hypothetical protein